MTEKSLKQQSTPCHFGGWRFDPADGKLISKQEQRRLQPRIAKLLAVFLANPDKLLSRNELIENLWQDRAVNEDALSRCVAELRSVLGDSTSNPVYIETIPKKGYRFIHPVNEASKPTLLWSAFAGVLLLIAFIYFLLPTASPTSAIQAAISNAQRLTTDLANEVQPELSNSGDKIAFSVNQNNQMVIKLVDTQDKTERVIQHEELHLSSATFSPDDSQLLVAGYKGQRCDILLYQLSDLQHKRVGQCALAGITRIFDWSPDGKRFAYVAPSSNSDNKSLWLFDLDSESSSQITYPTDAKVTDSNPRFSPNGKYLGFTRGTDSSRNIHYLAFDNTELVVAITHQFGFINGFEWLSDSRTLLFDSNHQGDKQLWLTTKDDPELTLLGGRDAQFLSMSQDNTRLAFQVLRYNANIWQVSTDSVDSKPSRIIHSIKYNNFPAYSPDGSAIAFSSNRQGKSSIWVYDKKSEQQSLVVSLPDQDLIFPQWSSDGKKLLFTRRGKDGYQCYQTDLATKSLELLTPNFSLFNCVYSLDDKVYGIVKSEGKVAQIVQLAENGATKSLTEFAVNRIQTTALDSIIYSRPGENKLFSMSLKDGEHRTVLDDFNIAYDEHWVVQGSYLYYPKTKAGRGIWRLNLQTGETNKVTHQLPSAIGLSLSVHPEHSQIIFSQTDSRESDVYISRVE
ncbi:winged helix-turn-helix domain-containing protein [Pleionea sp. CnH1-48]|uniref:winged helix-turn-helix domain-containing protein n=1 Tax=Pleionea sp. CnH1-48 TaxID=2954494 RepID=UPI002097A807|nr:winged helix-turn-helix domain-containing protein [Pleionea sp. CnH1-48]MCO7225597.1 winged helix-turn-helix domain-containing protein [Pleionea sp. CnH1-48]